MQLAVFASAIYIAWSILFKLGAVMYIDATIAE